MEQTFVAIKPDGVARGLVGEIISRFEKVGLKIVAIKMAQPDQAHYHHHYETIGTMITRHNEEVFNRTLKYMQTGPVVAMVLEGIEAVSQVRKMAGVTEPKSAAPGTIRGDYAHMSYAQADAKDIGVQNLIHASGDPAEAKLEIVHWFSNEELFDYQAAHEPHTR